MSCPSCSHTDEDVEMVSDAYGVRQRRDITHTCPICGYTEHRI